MKKPNMTWRKQILHGENIDDKKKTKMTESKRRWQDENKYNMVKTKRTWRRKIWHEQNCYDVEKINMTWSKQRWQEEKNKDDIKKTRMT